MDGKWYSDTFHFAAVCKGATVGVSIIPRMGCGDWQGMPFLTPGCVTTQEWEAYIDHMIRDLQKLKRRGPNILKRYNLDSDKFLLANLVDD